MNLNFFAKPLVATFFLACGPLSAAMITYSTTGTFIGAGSAAFTFTALGPSQVNTPTFGSLGDIVTPSSGGKVAGTLTITITVAASPGVTAGGTASLSGSLGGGSVTANMSNATFTPTAPTSVTIGGVTFTLISPVDSLVPSTTNNGITSIEASITGPASTSEASTFSMLFGGVFLAVIGAKKLRNRFI